MSTGEMQKKRRNFVHWLFFQDPNKGKHTSAQEDEWQVLSQDEFVEPIDIAIPLPYIGPERPFGAAPTIKRWVKLTVISDGTQEDTEVDTFPVEIGSVQSSIKLSDKNISPRHAVMNLHNGVLTITDTHSQNGVSIGDIWLTPGVAYPVNIGDIILIGRTKLVVVDYAGNPKAIPKEAPPLSQRLELFEVELPPEITTEITAEIPNEEPNIMIPVLQLEPLPEPEPVPEPEPEPEPVITKTTLTKILDESNVLLFRDMLGMREPVPPKVEASIDTMEEESSPPQEEAAEEPESTVPQEEKAEEQEDDIPQEEAKEPDSEIPQEESTPAPDNENLAKETEPITETMARPLTSEDIAEIFPVHTEEAPHVVELTAEELVLAIIDADLSHDQSGEEQNPAVETPADSDAEAAEAAQEILPDDLSSVEDFLETLIASASTSSLAGDMEMAAPAELPHEAGVICSTCNTANTDKDKFCGSCGTSLAPPAAPVKPFCSKCGTRNTNMTKFCGQCGHKM
ncbi:MAG: zinc ribbon domain-containing protein [Defluviitaleaceae bacterium]|nr:zinc ribbon domain-containing protein [Defluviitaleaceae bacterium]